MEPGMTAIIVLGSVAVLVAGGVFGGKKIYNMAHDKKMSATNGQNKTKSWVSFGGKKTRSYRASRNRKSGATRSRRLKRSKRRAT